MDWERIHLLLEIEELVREQPMLAAIKNGALEELRMMNDEIAAGLEQARIERARKAEARKAPFVRDVEASKREEAEKAHAEAAVNTADWGKSSAPRRL